MNCLEPDSYAAGRLPQLLALILCVTLLLGACQSPRLEMQAEQPAGVTGLSTHAAWSFAPLLNQSTTDTAAEAATALLQTHLHRRGLHATSTVEPARYRVEGTVTRWHYSGGVSPVPVVAIDLRVLDLPSKTPVWSASIAREGHRRENLTALGDRLLDDLVQRLPLNQGYVRPVGLLASEAAGAATIEARVEARGKVRVEAMGAAGAGTFETAPAALVAGLALKRAAPSILDADVQSSGSFDGRSVAFYYAADPPVDVLMQFDRLVLEPDNIRDTQLQQLTSRGSRAYAYVSVGEVGESRAYAREMDRSWILGHNPAWNSDVLDLSNPDLRAFLLKRVGQLHSDGYGGVFLDTMDSFNLVARGEEEIQAQQAGLVRLVTDIALSYPDLRIIANRGFEVMDRIAVHLEAVAAESLYAAWNNTQQRYTSVPANDREWLLAKLGQAKDLGLDVIVIDYLPPAQRSDARDIAARIAEHDFIPWVANPELDYVGVGALEIVPRKVLMLYDSTVDGPLEKSPVHKFVATPIEYMGYVPEYLDIASEPWPQGELKGRYAGIVTWPSRQFVDPAARPWLQKQLDDTVPVAFLSMPPVPLDKAMSQSLGIVENGYMDLDSARLVHQDDFIAAERTISPRIDSMGLVASSIATGNSVHMTYQDGKQQRSDVVVTGDFGGFAWQPGLVDDGLDYEIYWVLDPFRFLRTALQLPDAPMPDVTSESGRRIWLAHIDGDALPSWAELPGRQLGAEVIYDRILTRFRLPHTVSVVEGEMTAFPAYYDRRQRMFDIARKTFALDHVELASHTYSHPFKWAQLGRYRKSGRYNLKIDGYDYDPERDIAGSIGFIDRELAPPGKRTAVMLWSGDALPQASDMAVIDRLGLPNLNGGLTSVTRNSPSLTLVSPMARPVGEYLQVYAPVMNENMYTNNWLGPFDGFRRVTETFQMTESPRRLKPLNIYYHFYSGTKLASIKVLEEVYEWSVQQDINPLHVSDYSRKVPDWRRAGVARYIDGRWKLSGMGHVQSIRLLGQGWWPQLQDSRGIAGARQLHDAVYVHTDGADTVTFRTGSTEVQRPHLVSSNGRVLHWSDKAGRVSLRIQAEVPVSLEIGGAIGAGCSLHGSGRLVPGVRTKDDTLLFTFTTKDTGDAYLDCPA